MPKERLHLLLAEQSLQILTSIGAAPTLNPRQRFAFLLGAISPDTFYYDFPFFRLSSLCAAIHQMEGQRAFVFMESLLQECREHVTAEAAAWFIGFVSHLLADGFWHPIIGRMCGRDSFCWNDLNFSRRQCHHWLESELEAHWLSRIGPSDGYLPLLKQLARGSEAREQCLRYFRMLLTRMELNGIPDEKRIGRCLFWQASLLYHFSLPAWARWRPLFLKISATRSLGALIVPACSSLSHLVRHGNLQDERPEDPCAEELMARSVVFQATHLSLLSQHLGIFHPET